MDTPEQLLAIIDSTSYEDIGWSARSRAEKAAAISAATCRTDEAIQAWFERHGHKCSTKALKMLGSIAIECTSEAAGAFAQAVAGNEIPGVTRLLRNAQDITVEPIMPIGDGDEWVDKTTKGDLDSPAR
jgi:hypothetical protein